MSENQKEQHKYEIKCLNKINFIKKIKKSCVIEIMENNVNKWDSENRVKLIE